MAKSVLTVEYDYDFTVYGIVTPYKLYRLAWAVNNKLFLRLEKIDDLSLNLRKGSEKSYYQVFEQLNEENNQHIYMLGNRGTQGFLIPEQKKVDYFLVFNGDFDEAYMEEIKKGIAELDFVQTIFSVDHKNLKSKQNFIIQ